MKVIAKVSDKKYLIEIEHSEVEKVMGKYYGNLPALKVGDDVNLAECYDYAPSFGVCSSEYV